MSNEFFAQLWSGTYASILGSVFGAAAAIVVLHYTNRHQTRLSDKALREQRDESRRAREIMAVSSLIECLTNISSLDAPTIGTNSGELVTCCDQLILNAPTRLGDAWRQTEPHDTRGLSRHPIAQAIGIRIAINELANLPRSMDVWGGSELQLSVRQAIELLISWPRLTESEILDSCRRLLEHAEDQAMKYALGFAESIELNADWTPDGHEFRRLLARQVQMGLAKQARNRHEIRRIVERPALRAIERHQLSGPYDAGDELVEIHATS